MRCFPAALVLCAAALGCGSPQLCIGTPELGWIRGIAFPVGTEVPFRAGGVDILGECDLPAPSGVTWASSAPALAVVTENGVLRAVSPGKVDVIARRRDEEVRYPVTVTPTVARLEIHPGDTSIAVGDTVELRAVAYGTDGAPLPDIVVGMQAMQNPRAYPGGPSPDGFHEANAPGSAAPLFRTNVLRVYARESGVTGRVTAWVMGRADTVQLRAVAP